MICVKKKTQEANSLKKPFLLKYRSCDAYVIVTASFSLLTGAIIYSIIIPIVPFIIDAMNNGRPLSEASRLGYTDQQQAADSISTSASRDAGILLALYAAASMIASPMFGYLGDKATHRRTPMLFGIIALLVSTFFLLYATQYWMLVVARLLQGFSDGCVWTLSLVLISDTFPPNALGTQMGRVLISQTVGMTLGAPIGVLFDKAGFKAPFIFCIGLAGVDFILRLFLVERRNSPKDWFPSAIEQPSKVGGCDDKNMNNISRMNEISITNDEKEHRDSRHDNKKADIEKGADCTESVISDCESDIASSISSKKHSTQSISTLQLLCNSRIIVALLVELLISLVTTSLEPSMPVHLRNVWGYSSSQVGLVFLAQVIPTFLAMPISGYLYDRFGPKILCFSAILIAATAITFMGIPSQSTLGGVIPLIILLIIMGSFLPMLFTPVYPEVTHAVASLTQDIGGGEDATGRGYGLISSVFCLGNFLGPLLGGFLFDAIGFFWLCIVMTCVLVLLSPFPVMFLGEKKLTPIHLYRKVFSSLV